MEDYLTQEEIIGKYDLKRWQAIAAERKQKSQPVRIHDKQGRPYWFVLTPEILALISEIEQNRGFLASLKLPKKILAGRMTLAQNYESYYSSHIEGAMTSLEAALLQLKYPSVSKKKFQDESLQMIVNNKAALTYVQNQRDKPFNHQMICELQKTLTFNTHRERSITVGEYRKGKIYVVNRFRQVVYEGPLAEKVFSMMDEFVNWMNAGPEAHPLIQAALVHLCFVHIHPFDDGNGRSSRALANLYLDKQGYSFINLLSLSDYFDHFRAAYYKAIQNFEKHDGDATFFVSYVLQALANQLGRVKAEIEKEGKVQDIKELIRAKDYVRLDKKQVKALQWMLAHSEKMTTQKYCKLNRCSDETARRDFNFMLELGLIESVGEGRAKGYLLKS